MRLIILGAGGYGQTVADMARQSGRYAEILFLDDEKQDVDIIGVCSNYERYADEDTEMYPAFGNNVGRMNWIKKLTAAGIPVMTLLHSLAYVSPQAMIETGVIILPYAVVNTNCVIKKGSIINCGTIVDHGCIIEEGVHLSPGAIVKAENRIPSLMKVESGKVIQNRCYPI